MYRGNEALDCLKKNQYELVTTNQSLYWKIFNKAASRAERCNPVSDTARFMELVDIALGAASMEYFEEKIEKLCVEKSKCFFDALLLMKEEDQNKIKMRKLGMDKKQIYVMSSYLTNFWLVLAVVFVVVYLLAPLFGGKLLIKAIIFYASWIGMALSLKFILKRRRHELRIKAHEYLLICLYYIVCMLIWFFYPLNVIISILSIVGFTISYRAQDKKINQHRNQGGIQ